MTTLIFIVKDICNANLKMRRTRSAKNEMTRNDFSGEIMGGSSIGEILTVSLCLARSRVVHSTCSSARAILGRCWRRWLPTWLKAPATIMIRPD